jgi:hypothetical protein
MENQLRDEKERYQQLYEQFQYLQGEYSLVITKLLPAATKITTPWWRRLFRFHKKE